jgi:hypothetical protein
MRRAVAVVITTTALAVTFASCSLQTGLEDEMTPEESRDQMVAVVDETAALFHITDWSAMSEPYSQSCELEGGGEGVTFNYLIAAPAPGTDHLVDARAVADHWEGLGMSVRVVESPTITVYAEGGPAARMSFSTEPGDYGIGGTSLCVPGNADDFRGAS